MAGITSPVISALQGAKCWSTDSIAVELCWHFGYRRSYILHYQRSTQAVILIAMELPDTTQRASGTRVPLQSSWIQSWICSRGIHSWLDKGHIYLISNMQSYWNHQLSRWKQWPYWRRPSATWQSKMVKVTRSSGNQEFHKKQKIVIHEAEIYVFLHS